MTDDVRETLAGEGADATPPAEESREPQAGEEAASPGQSPAAGLSPTADTADFKDRWLRAEAELQNVRRRAIRDRDESVAASENRFLLDLVELLDDLERALGSMDPAQGGAAWVQGVSLTAQRMRDTLARWNVMTVATVGRPFDPNVHEALAEIEAPDGIAPGHVAQEIQRGYRRGERTLRAARVIVAREKH
jgi:molecular chaperone GrpE